MIDELKEEHYIQSLEGLELRQSEIDAILEIIEDLKFENAALREKLSRSVELPCKLGADLFTIEKHYEFITYGAVEYRIENKYYAGEIVICEDGRFCFYTPTWNPKCLVFGKDIFTTREAAEARLAELKGEQL